jgi:hypothetical protein
MSLWFGGPKSCNLCGAETETTFHVLNNCKKRLWIYKLRHDAALKIFTQAFSLLPTSSRFHRLLVDLTCPYTLDTLRPDVQAYQDVKLVARLYDMKCPWARIGYVTRTHDKNFEYYTELAARVRVHFPETTLETIIVPTTGPVPKHTHDALAKIFGAKHATRLLCNMSAAVARVNYKLRRTLRMKPLGPTPCRAAQLAIAELAAPAGHVPEPHHFEVEQPDLDLVDTQLAVAELAARAGHDPVPHPFEVEQHDLDMMDMVTNLLDESPPTRAPVVSGAGVPPDGRRAD